MVERLKQIPLDSYKPLREVVVENIRQAIISGQFPAGMRLMELQLAEEMGVSRTPVREAIRKMELEGLVVMIPRRGAYVANISIKDINEVYEVRTALDVLAAGLAAEKITDEEVAEMHRLIETDRPLVAEKNYPKIIENDTAFHDIIYRASGNRRCMTIISNLREQITAIRGRSMPYPGRLEVMLEEHTAIADAIAKHNAKKAQEAVRVHMENAERTLLRVIEEQTQIPTEKKGKKVAANGKN